VTDRDQPTEADESVGPVVHDRRRIDPETGALREGAAASRATVHPTGVVGGDPLAAAQAEAAERLDDLRRLQAEYVNYRRRVERDREVIRDTAVANVLTNLLPVLDDIGRARDHGELEGGFKSVADALEAAVGKLGLERFGEPGEPFDPSVHEALTHSHSAEVTEPTAVQVFQPGYRIGARVVRPARVGVADPE
jgi:molecular chaperone GrpE